MSEPTGPVAGEDAPAFIEAETAHPLGGPGQATRTDRARSSAYRSRFSIIYVALVLLAALGVGALVTLVGRPEPGPPAKWSTWQPAGSETARARQIADRVAKSYRLQGGQQLAAVLASAPKVSGAQGDVPVSAIALRPDTSTGKKEESQIDVIPTENSLQYILCGLGKNCSIKGGKASVARHALLRREALELALYSFKYVDGVKSVSVFLPPRPDGAAPGTAVFLKRSDVEAELGKPLLQSVGATAPEIGKMTKPELALVDHLTAPRLYTYEYQGTQDGGAVLIYTPVVPGT